MRVFSDQEGREWEVVVGRESWGAFFAIFVPRGWDSTPRETLLDADTMEGAMKAVVTMGEGELREALARSRLKSME